MVQSLTLFVSKAQIFGCCKNRRDAAHLQQPLWEASAHLENSLVPLATARAGEGQGFFCIIPYPAFLSTAALQEFMSPSHLHHTAVAAQGFYPADWSRDGAKLHKPAVMALHEESSACSPCSLFPALRGSSLQVQEWGSCSQGEGGLGTGTGAGCGNSPRGLHLDGNGGTCSWELLPAATQAPVSLLGFGVFLYRQIPLFFTGRKADDCLPLPCSKELMNHFLFHILVKLCCSELI